MSTRTIQTAQGLCAVAMTKYLMKRDDLRQDEAYARLLKMETYQLLMDDGTRMFLESSAYLEKCCEIELDQGVDALYEFIKPY